MNRTALDYSDTGRIAEGEAARMLEGLVRMSNRYGQKARYVLAGGGNTSCKTDAEIYVKASGTSLAAVRAEDFVSLSRRRLDAILANEYTRGDDARREAEVLADMMDARLPGNEAKRPSVETLLHNIFPERLVLHLHPALVNGLTCGADGETLARRRIKPPFVWIQAYRPGYELALLCRDRLDAHARARGVRPRIILLQNHGIFVSGDSTDEIDATLRTVMKSLARAAFISPDRAHVSQKPLDERLLAATKAVAAVFPPPARVKFAVNAEMMRLFRSEESFFPLSAPFTPDHIVYCKPAPLYLQSLEGEEGLRRRVEAFERAEGYAPRVICVKNLGAFFAGGSQREADSAALLFADAVDVAVYSENFGGPLHMPKELVDFILNWEIESYRQKVNA